MTFISFAQNFEDVMLWRALAHIEKGFYIDVGACWPEKDSVTKAFYDRGWSGINVEPAPDLCARFREVRPWDLNLELAITDIEGSAEFYAIRIPTDLSLTGLSTLDKTIAAERAANGFVVSKPVLVPTCTLASICQNYVRQDSEIHFLKIDVEGLEEAAIRGADWNCYRPWIVIVEATRPMTRIASQAAWEPMLLEVGYSLVYCDGLNNFYVARERAELTAAFVYPPNVFDNFTRFAEDQATARADAAAVQIKALQAHNAALQANALKKTDALQTRVDTLEATADALCKTLDTMQATWSWRITRPLRFIAGTLSHYKQTIRELATRWGQRSERVREKIIRQAGAALNIGSRVDKFPCNGWTEDCADDSDLTPRARQIHRALKRAIARRRSG